MLRSCLTKHLLKADILFRGEFEIIPVDSGICRCRASDPLFRGCHQSGSLSGVTRERHPASQSEHLSYAEKLFGIQRYSSLPSGDGKNPRRRISDRSSENPPLRLPGRVCSRCNITTVRAPKQALRADWSGRERTSEARYLVGCILHHEQNLSLSKDETQYSKPSFLHSFYKSFMESIWQAGTPLISTA